MTTSLYPIQEPLPGPRKGTTEVLVVIDNYDSFTYNLVQMMSLPGLELKVYRNDEITLAGIEALKPGGLVVSPGPCTPKEAGVSVESLRYFSGRIPILAVCLGHQSLAVAFEGNICGAKRIMHGKTSMITHDDTPLYKGMTNPFSAGRYHSLAVDAATLPQVLVVDARSEDGEIMGMHHRDHPTYGVQFHPESVLTPSGKRLLRNFLDMIPGE
jgi:anthranilate synthase/aminodeoxychorismate synthase-like glutamine amidotransferase